jgi:hypothetical protein
MLPQWFVTDLLNAGWCRMARRLRSISSTFVGNRHVDCRAIGPLRKSNSHLSGESLALATSPYQRLHVLRCDRDAERDELVLRGTVRSFYLKQLAQETALKAGCCNLRNEIEVLES